MNYCQMKILSLFLATIFNMTLAISQTDLCDEILLMSEKDQEVRRLYHKAKFDVNLKMTDSIKFILTEQIKKIDSILLIEKKEIFKTYGFIDTIRFGKDCSNNFWVLMQHSDKDIKFQKEYLKLFKKNINKGIKKNYAYLMDRVQINTGKKQLYGTQINIIEGIDGKIIEPKPTRCRKKLNIRRKKMGLNSIEDYIESFYMLFNGTLKME